MRPPVSRRTSGRGDEFRAGTTASLYRRHGDGVLLSIRLTPKSSRDAVEGVTATADGGVHLGLRVRAVPEDGGANKALVALLAKWANLRKSDIEIVSGTMARLKTVLLHGDPEKLTARLDRLCAAFAWP
jgi:uncharacterized protein (TIGR00251 family)